MKNDNIRYVISSRTVHNKIRYFYMYPDTKRHGWTLYKYKAYRFKTKETALTFGKRYFKDYKDWTITTYNIKNMYADTNLYDNYYNDFYSQYNKYHNNI